MAVRAVVADFPRREDARAAVSRLGEAGFGPEAVEVIADDPELARDVGGRSYVRLGAIAGAVVGVVFTAGVILAGGGAMLASPAGTFVGAVGVIGGLAFIGIVFGRTLVRRSADSAEFASRVARGDVLVEVRCHGESCRRAHTLMASSGAVDVRDEASPGPT